MLYLIGRELLVAGGNVVDDVHSAVKAGGLLWFIVGPVNAYFFGLKTGNES